MFDRPPARPVIIRVLDYVSVAAALLAVTIAVTGGFREWMPWGRVSMTSWARPLIIAIVAAGIRHWLQARPTLATRVWHSARRLAGAEGVRQALPIFLSTRTVVLLVGLLAVGLFGYRAEAAPPWRLYENELLNLPARWDTGWYIGIAAEGYRWQPSRITVQQNIAFFPAYPMLMRYGALFLGRELMWTGVLIAWASFFAALVYLYRFCRERFGDESGRATVALLACYPFALFFSTAYTEALFLLTLVAACYHFERDERWRAAAWGLVAGLTRPNGCLLSVVLAFIALRPLWPLRWPVPRPLWTSLAARTAVAALPGIGMLMYSAFIYKLTGHPLQWAAQNAAWGRVYRGVDTLFDEQVLDQEALYTFAATQPVDALQLAAVLFVAAALWPVTRRLGVAYGVFLAINIVPPLLMGGLLSMGRVTSVLFPAFIWLALAVPARHRTAWLVGFAMLQALCAALFFTWRPLF